MKKTISIFLFALAIVNLSIAKGKPSEDGVIKPSRPPIKSRKGNAYSQNRKNTKITFQPEPVIESELRTERLPLIEDNLSKMPTGVHEKTVTLQAISLYRRLFGRGSLTLEMENYDEGWIGDEDTGGYIAEGAFEEDTGVLPAAHFCAGGDGSELTTGLLGWISAYTRAIDITYNNALYYSPMYSRNDKSLAYWWLGHTAHLLQDMCTPAHVHNDQHLVGDDEYEDYLFDNYYNIAVPNSFASDIQLFARSYDYSNLEGLFRETTDYTDDYDSDDYRGDYYNSTTGDYFPSNRLSELGRQSYHNPSQVDNSEGDLTSSECAVLASDLLPWAVEQTAMLFRLYYRTTNQLLSAPVANMSYDCDSADFSWDTVPGAWGYVIQRSTYSDYQSYVEFQIAGGSNTTYSDTTVLYGQTYYYRIFAYDNVAGVGIYGYWNAITINSPPTPNPPTGIDASDGTYADRVRIIWNASNGADEYQVYRATSSGGTKTPLGNWQGGTSFDDYSPNPGQTYYYWVKARNNCGESGYSNYDTGYRATSPMISRSQSSLSNSCLEGTDAPSQNFEVWNSGTGTLDYTITDDVGWLECSPDSGTSSGGHDTINVNYITSGLSAENYSATITITDPQATNSPETIQVDLTVTDQPMPIISLEPASLNNACQEGRDASSQSFDVWNSGAGTLDYTIIDDADWLSCSPTDGQSTGEHDPIEVSYATSGLLIGTYNATITISDSAASNSPQTIAVELSVVEPEEPQPDIDSSGIVDFGDFAILASHWEDACSDLNWCDGADLDMSTDVGLSDLRIICGAWLEIHRELLYEDTLDSYPGWTIQGEWAFGQPTGGGAIYGNGNPDPTSGYTGNDVYGVDLNGDYDVAVGGPYYLTAGPFDCNDCNYTELQFARWLNSDSPPYVRSRIEASNNGIDWQIVWEQSDGQTITDSDWQIMEYDISAIADNQLTVYIRWSYEIISDEAYPYSGWNIDDIQLWGIR